jgi:hypothetical protein
MNGSIALLALRRMGAGKGDTLLKEVAFIPNYATRWR